MKLADILLEVEWVRVQTTKLRNLPKDVQEMIRELYDAILRRHRSDLEEVGHNNDVLDGDIQNDQLCLPYRDRGENFFTARRGEEDDDHPIVNRKEMKKLADDVKAIIKGSTDFKKYFKPDVTIRGQEKWYLDVCMTLKRGVEQKAKVVEEDLLSEGACDSYVMFDAKLTKDEVLKKYKDYCEELRHEHGHDHYGGHLGCKPGGIKFFDGPVEKDKVEDFILNKSDKYDQAAAVKTKNHTGKDVWLVGGWCPE